MFKQIENRMVVDSEWPSPKVFCHCDFCGRDIYEGSYYFNFDGDIVCEDCEREYINEHFRRCAE